MIPVSQKKLRETQFFLGHLERERRKTVRNEPEAFLFYLSAFLSAARAVTWTLKKEEKARYEAWFPVWLSGRSQEDRWLLNLMVEQRNAVQKEGKAETRQEWEYLSIFEVEPEEGGQFQFFGPPDCPPPRVGRPVHRFESGDEEVTAACRRHLELLRILVADFIKAHPRG